MRNKSKIFNSVLMSVYVLFILWMFLSWIDIIMHNSNPHPVYSEYNAFIVMYDFVQQVSK